VDYEGPRSASKVITICTFVPEIPLEQFRWLVKYQIDGIARGCVPFFHGPNALPPLYESGIVYQEEPQHGSGVECFDLPMVVLERGWGDCDDLCIYLIAELLSQNIKAEASIADWKSQGGMHVQVRLPDGTIEDPSMKLGAVNQWPENFLYDRQ
jgi:hypothetical protein